MRSNTLRHNLRHYWRAISQRTGLQIAVPLPQRSGSPSLTGAALFDAERGQLVPNTTVLKDDASLAAASSVDAPATHAGSTAPARWWRRPLERAHARVATELERGGAGFVPLVARRMASIIEEMRGDRGEAVRWASVAEDVAPNAAYLVAGSCRLAVAMGRYGQAYAHSYFIRRARRA